jgi:hypothetical protein
MAYHLATGVSIGLFLFYGVACLFAGAMVEEFERYGLSPFRRITGGLEVLGAGGLAAGYVVPAVGVMSAVGLSLLMLLGIGARIRVRDPLISMLPAGFLLGLNAFIAFTAAGWTT